MILREMNEVLIGWLGSNQENIKHCKYLKNLLQGNDYTDDGRTEKLNWA